MGTSLLDTHLPILKSYDKILVALDKDATVKALQLVRKLQSHVSTGLVVLNKDLKDMTNDERRDTFKRHVD